MSGRRDKDGSEIFKNLLLFDNIRRDIASRRLVLGGVV